MTRLILRFALLLIMASFHDASAATPASVEPKSYQVEGILRSWDASTRQACISHREIPGYMEAMTMNFELLDPKELESIQAGDSLSFRLQVIDDRAWIDQVHKLKPLDQQFFSTPAPERQAELAVGDLLPDADFLDQSGKKIELRNFRGEALAVTFIYTRCPLPTYCPLMNRNFSAAQNLLAKLTPRRDWHLLSISLDPEHDTPEVLSAYSRDFHPDTERWTFAAPQNDSLSRLARGVGLEFNKSTGGIDHNLRTVVLDGTGRIRRIFKGNEWTPQELASEIRAALPKRGD